MRKPDNSALRIRYYREAKGYSQEYMAEMLEISQSTYANLESGKSSMSVGRLLRISEILETDLPALLNFPSKLVTSKNGTSYPVNLPDDHSRQEIKEVYQELITELRQEIEFLKSLIKPSQQV